MYRTHIRQRCLKKEYNAETCSRLILCYEDEEYSHEMGNFFTDVIVRFVSQFCGTLSVLAILNKLLLR